MKAREKIGTITFTAPQRQRQTYECAAWYRDYECPAQTCDVYMTRNPEGWPGFICYGLEGVCVDAHLASYWGGVRVSKDDPSGRAAIGQPGTVGIQLYTYQLPANVSLDAGYEWLADQTRWPREVADRKLRQAIEYRTPLDRLAREINIDFLRANGSPDLVAQLA